MLSTSLLPCFHKWPYLGLLDNFPCCFTLLSVSLQAFVACHTLEDCQMANPHHSYTLHVCTIFSPPKYLLLLLSPMVPSRKALPLPLVRMARPTGKALPLPFVRVVRPTQRWNLSRPKYLPRPAVVVRRCGGSVADPNLTLLLPAALLPRAGPARPGPCLLGPGPQRHALPVLMLVLQMSCMWG